MEYRFLSEDHKLNAAVNRLLELEQQHYSALVLLSEAQAVGDQNMVTHQTQALQNLEPRIQYYNEQLFPKPETEESEAEELEDEPKQS